MALYTHNTIRLDTALSGDLPTAEYRVIQDGMEKIYEPAMVKERSLTGKMHIHRVTTVGVPLVFDNYQYTLWLLDEELDVLKTLLAKVVYFMPHYRDEVTDPTDYRVVMLVSGITDVKPLDPGLDYYLATITLEVATGNQVA